MTANDLPAVFGTLPLAWAHVLPGWTQDITGCREASDLPSTAREYLSFIEDFIGVPVKLLGVGPAKDQVVWFGGAESVLAAAA